jgi:hypothetical protein
MVFCMRSSSCERGLLLASQKLNLQLKVDVLGKDYKNSLLQLIDAPNLPEFLGGELKWEAKDRPVVPKELTHLIDEWPPGPAYFPPRDMCVDSIAIRDGEADNSKDVDNVGGSDRVELEPLAVVRKHDGGSLVPPRPPHTICSFLKVVFRRRKVRKPRKEGTSPLVPEFSSG